VGGGGVEWDEIVNIFLIFQFLLNVCIYDQFLSVFSRNLNKLVAVWGITLGAGLYCRIVYG